MIPHPIGRRFSHARRGVVARGWRQSRRSFTAGLGSILAAWLIVPVGLSAAHSTRGLVPGPRSGVVAGGAGPELLAGLTGPPEGAGPHGSVPGGPDPPIRRSGSVGLLEWVAADPLPGPAGPPGVSHANMDESGPGPEARSGAFARPNGADLEVSKSGPSSAVVGERVRYVITTTNRGVLDASRVGVQDRLPPGATFLGGSRGATLGDDGVVRWPVVEKLVCFDSVSDTVWVSYGLPGRYRNTAGAWSHTSDPDEANNTAGVTTVVEGRTGTADLEIERTGPPRGQIGEILEYRIRTRNLGPGSASDVRIADILAEGADFVDASGGGEVDEAGVVRWPTIPRMDPGHERTETVRLRFEVPGRYRNRALVVSETDDPDLSNNSSTLFTSVRDLRPADLSIVKTGPSEAAPGEVVVYDIEVRNAGPGVGEWVAVEDRLPPGAELVDATGTFTVENGVVTWAMIHTLPRGESVRESLSVRFSQPGTYTDVAVVSGRQPDPEASNDQSRVTTVVRDAAGGADVAIRKDGPALARVGEEITYVLTTRNNGPDPAAQVRVTDRLPAGVRFVRGSRGAEWTGSEVVWPVLELLTGSLVDTLVVRVESFSGGLIRNEACIEAATADPVAGNDCSRFVTREGALADLALTKDAPAQAQAGEPVTFTITVRNLGPAAAEDVVIEDIVPPELTDVTPEPVEGVVRWVLDEPLEAGESVTRTVTASAPAVQVTLVNRATVRSLTDDPEPGNNEDSSTTEVLAAGVLDLSLSDVAQPASFVRGSGGAFTLRVTNVGQRATTDTVRVDGPLPAGLTWVPREQDGPWTLAYEPATRRVRAWTTETIDPGASSAFSILVDVDLDAPIQVEHVAVVATPGDAVPENDTARAVVPIPPTAVGSLTLSKRALRPTATVGDLISYELIVENDGDAVLEEAVVVDQLPPALRLVDGSVAVNGAPVPDPSAPGPVLTLPVGALGPSESARLTYTLLVGAGTPIGPAMNTAQAWDLASDTRSGPATAVVEIVDDGVFTEEGLILGKVFIETVVRGDAPDSRTDTVRIGIPGVRVLLQDGTAAITDVEGNYNFISLRPRLWVVRIDQTTLPAGIELSPYTHQHADRGTSLFVDLYRGEMHRADFGSLYSPEDPAWMAALDGVTSRRDRGEAADVAEAPFLAEWMRERTDARRSRDVQSAFAPILPESSLNQGNSSLGPRPADPVAAGLIGDRATQDGPLSLRVDQRFPSADGSTPIDIHVALSGREGGDGVAVTLEASRGRWGVDDLDPVTPGVQIRLQGREVRVPLFAPDGPGDGTVRATALDREVEIVVPWGRANAGTFLVTGLVEGRVDAGSVKDVQLFGGTVRGRFQDRLEELVVESDDGRYRGGVRAAAFATGQVGDETDLTLRFDTEKDPTRQLFEDIRPEDFYGLYGDASVKRFGAQSRGRFFGALERGSSYLMYGDLLTGAGGGDAMSLGRYRRTVNGLAQHFVKEMDGMLGLKLDAFASYDRSSQIVDEFRGQGISGPYRLSRTDGLINSEQVELVVRDRNQPSIILRRERLERFLDYTVEPFTGRVLFKRPIPSLDDQLNPMSVRVTYEVQQTAAQREWVYGFNGALQATGRMELGGGVVRDENPMSGIDLSSGNATVRLAQNTHVFGEIARSDSAGVMGDATRVEVRHGSRRVDARAYYLKTDSTFANPSSGFYGGRREVGLRARADLSRRVQILGEALRTESLLTGGEREGAQVALRFGERWSAEVGMRYAEETTPVSAETVDAVPYDLNSLRARLTAPLPERVDGAVFAEYEQDVSDGSQRRVVIGGDIRVLDRARLYGRHELISSLVGPYGLNSLQDQHNTVFGIAADYKASTQLFSEYRARDAFSGREAQAAIGLRNQWAVAEGVRLSTSFERLSPLGLAGPDALAVTGALEYTANPLWKGTLRSELRSSDDQDHFLGSLGYARRLGRDWTLLGQSVLSHIFDGGTYERSRLGLAYRDTGRNRWNALWRYEHRYDQAGAGQASIGGTIPAAGTGTDWTRSAHIVSTHVDHRPTDRFTVRGQYGAKVVTEDAGGRTSTEPSSVAGARIVYDLGNAWDLGVAGWALRTGGLVPVPFGDAALPQSQYALGFEVGWTPSRDLRIAVGYNAFGFTDDDLVPEQPTDRGPYLKVGLKIDELFRLDGEDLAPPPPPVAPPVRPQPTREDPTGRLFLTMGGPRYVQVGDTVPFVLSSRYSGLGDPGPAVVTDSLPATADFIRASGGGAYDASARAVRWTVPREGLPRADTVWLRFTTPGTWENTGFVRASSLTDSATVRVNVEGTVPVSLTPGDSLPPIVYFDFDADSLTARSRQVLESVAAYVRGLPDDVMVGLIGHADSIGTSAYNLDLGQRRANRVQRYLADVMGLAAARILTPQSDGESRPVSRQDTPRERDLDRRVEFYYCPGSRGPDEQSPFCRRLLRGAGPGEPGAAPRVSTGQR